MEADLRLIRLGSVALLACAMMYLLFQVQAVYADSFNQIPTVSIPTVTGTPAGAIAIVTMEQDQINVRSGPGIDYPTVGVLIAVSRCRR